MYLVSYYNSFVFVPQCVYETLAIVRNTVLYFIHHTRYIYSAAKSFVSQYFFGKSLYFAIWIRINLKIKNKKQTGKSILK